MVRTSLDGDSANFFSSAGPTATGSGLRTGHPARGARRINSATTSARMVIMPGCGLGAWGMSTRPTTVRMGTTGSRLHLRQSHWARRFILEWQLPPITAITIQQTRPARSSVIWRPSQAQEFYWMESRAIMTTGISSADSGNLKIWRGTSASGTPFETEIFADVDVIYVSGLDGNDTVTLDFTDGKLVPNGGLSIDGGAGTNNVYVIGDANNGVTTLLDYIVGASPTLVGSMVRVNNANLTFNSSQHISSLDIEGSSVASLASIGNGTSFNVVAMNTLTINGHEREHGAILILAMAR